MKARKKKMGHFCTVCGEQALYVFYGALACDSCRTFFRRQVIQTKKLSCLFTNSCEIRLNTRKDCAKCRLQKCLRVGMNQALVAMNESDEMINSYHSPAPEQRAPDVLLHFLNQSPERLILEVSRGSAPFALTSPRGTLVICGLSSTEQSRLLEMILFVASLGQRMTMTSLPPGHKLLMKIIYVSAEKIMAAVNEIKSLQILTDEDKLTLLRGAVAEMIFLFSVSALDATDTAWAFPCYQVLNKQIPIKLRVDIMREIKNNGRDLYYRYKKFIEGFDEKWRRDQLLLTICNAICLFNPERENLVEREIVRTENGIYLRLLRRYLETVYEKQHDANLAFLAIQRKLLELKSITEVYQKTEVDVKDSKYLELPVHLRAKLSITLDT